MSQTNLMDIDKELLQIEVDEIKPYDPKDVNISFKIFLLDSLLQRIRHNEIDLSQRRTRWSIIQQSRLIESILIRLPLPAYYFDGSNDYNWTVIDGIQRLQTFADFIINETFELRGLEFLHELVGHKFSDLPRDLQRRIFEAELHGYIINPGTPPMVKFSIFHRINTGGMALKSQEIRDVLYPIASNFLQALAELAEFKTATSNSIPTRRMQDSEYILRFIALFSSHEYPYSMEMDEYLNYTMWKLNDMSEHRRQSIKEDFTKAMKTAIDVFGFNAFRKPSETNSTKRPINKGLFEAWAVIFAKLSDNETDKLKKMQEKLNFNFKKAVDEDNAFKISISTNANSFRNVSIRFETIQKIIQMTLNDN